jgi:predicted nucleic acid-binding protein
MKPANANFFIDSNVIIYSLEEDSTKKLIALELLQKNPFIASQVVFESINVALRKLRLSKVDVINFAKLLLKYS